MASNEIYSHYLSGMTPADIESFKDIFPEFCNLNVEEVLLLQESCLQHIQNNKEDVTSACCETSHGCSVLANEIESSNRASIETQLALDEALARALELGDDIYYFSTEEHGSSAIENTRSTSTEMPGHGVENQDIREDEIDPDRMTYEELQSLGEAVGSESKGLPADLMDRLPKFKYKDGFFSSRKKKKEQCVICYTEYVNGAQLIVLPCAHQYHSKCIKKWLADNKSCPVCLKEVKDE